MSTRLILVVPTVFAICVVAVSLKTTSADAVDQCLAAPNATSPAGKHWYYRLNKTTGIRCWYLAEKTKKVRSETSPIPVPTRKPAADAAIGVTAPDAAVGVTPPVAAPNDIVTIFSQAWPNALKPVGTIGRAPTTGSTTVSESEGAELQTAPDETTPSVRPVVAAEAVRPVVPAEGVRTVVPAEGVRPVVAAEPVRPVVPAEGVRPVVAAEAVGPVLSAESVRPVVLSADEPARADSSLAPSFQNDHTLPLIVGSLCLAGIVGLLGALAGVRRRQHRPVWNPGPAPWRSVDTTTQLGPRPGRETLKPGTDLQRETRDAPELERELESTLQDLINGRRRRAA